MDWISLFASVFFRKPRCNVQKWVVIQFHARIILQSVYLPVSMDSNSFQTDGSIFTKLSGLIMVSHCTFFLKFDSNWVAMDIVLSMGVIWWHIGIPLEDSNLWSSPIISHVFSTTLMECYYHLVGCLWVWFVYQPHPQEFVFSAKLKLLYSKYTLIILVSLANEISATIPHILH